MQRQIVYLQADKGGAGFPAVSYPGTFIQCSCRLGSLLDIPGRAGKPAIGGFGAGTSLRSTGKLLSLLEGM